MNNPGHSQFPSIKLDQLVYVELEAGNGGMMLTVSEDGFTFRAVTPVAPSRKMLFSFVVNGTEKLEGYGNIDWTQDGGKVASMQFVDLTPEFHAALRKWLTQLSAPAVPSFANDHFVNAEFGQGRIGAPTKSSAVEPVAVDAVVPSRAPSLGEFVSDASLFSSPAGLNDRANSAPAASPEPPASRETFLVSDWEYPRKSADSRSHVRGVALAAIFITVVALAVILYGYHDSVGQLLISLGQKISAPKEASATQPSPAPQPLRNSEVPKPTVLSQQPLPSAKQESLPPSPKKELANEVHYHAENTSVAVKPDPAFRDVSSGPAAALETQDPADRARSLWAAVAQGNTSAEVTLAKLYLIGGGVTKNCDQARVLLQAAAKKGNGEALDKLSQINQQGCP